MQSTQKDYGVGECCPWPRDAMPYIGLCSHSPLLEAVRGDLDLTPAQLESLAEEAKKRKTLLNGYWYKVYRYQDTERFLARKRKNGVTYCRVNAARKAEICRRSAARAKEARRFWCSICVVRCTNGWMLERHERSRRHKLASERDAEGKLKFACPVCGKRFIYQCYVDRHMQGQRCRELAAARAAAEAANATSD